MWNWIKKYGAFVGVMLFTVWLWVPGLFLVAWSAVPLIVILFSYVIIHNIGSKSDPPRT